MSRTTYSKTRGGRARNRATPTPAEATSGPIGAPLVLVILFVIMVIVDQSRGGGGAKAVTPLPGNVVGTWVARDPRDAGRFTQIDQDLVVLRREDGAGGGWGRDRRPAHAPGRRRGGPIDYRMDDGPTFIEVMPDGKGLRLRHPSDVSGCAVSLRPHASQIAMRRTS